MAGQPSERELLIALNAQAEIPRAAVYRLAAERASWAGLQGDEGIELMAAAIGVPSAPLRRAVAIVERAREIAERESAAAARHGARIVTFRERGYPAPLALLRQAPPVLVARGEMPAGPAVAVVGSRRVDARSRAVCERFARAIAEAGVTVVSGLASGMDAAAHRGALALPEGRTVAVLGCGLDVDYPRGHAALAQEIARQGMLLSEFPCGAGPRRWHFPTRNRVIAALASATLVVPTAAGPGTLLTVRQTLRLGRPVFAASLVPGDGPSPPGDPIWQHTIAIHHPREILDWLGVASASASASPPAIAQDVQDAQDAQDAFDSHPPPNPQPNVPSPPFSAPPPPGLAGRTLLAIPPGAFRNPETIAAEAGAPIDAILGALLELELEGLIRRLPGAVYVRT
ncbi:MAG TPA: DNA-processing protein DprA [Thermoanaerobaculia bacterium]|nr:DNA-processing protein DprA [Thermoanaerobaculia bacterium]